MLETIIFIISIAIIHRLRGWSPSEEKELTLQQKFLSAITGKVFFCPSYLGLSAYLYTGDWIFALIAALGYQLYVVLGWGDYWDGSDRVNKEVGLIDDLVGKYLEPGFWNDFVSMSLRGLICLPLFIGLAFYQGELLTALSGILMSLQGGIYHGLRILTNDNGWHEYAELSIGALIGILLWGAS
jgi:hypothetical protein